ncbi:DUF805 domain-containing protein [Aquimarina rhabdastrellae]
MEWYLKVLKNYANFEGRARRKEYWMFVLFNALITIGIAIVAGIFTAIAASIDLPFLSIIFWIVYVIYALAMILPTLAVAVRRLHDTGNSGWMYLITLIPLIGPIWLLVLMATEGDYGDNQYGPDPKVEEQHTNPLIS